MAEPEHPPLNIVITGVTVSGNMGGNAMLRSAMQELERLAPGSTFTLLSYMPAADRRMPPIANLRIVSADYRWLVLVYLPLAFVLAPFLAFASVRRVVATIPYFRALEDADLVVDLCGIAFSDGRGLPLLAYNVACVLPALAMRRPVAKLAQALGPFKETLNRLLARAILSRCCLVVARGETSYRHLDDLGLTNVASLPDVSFCLLVDDRDRAKAREILAAHHIPPGGLVVSPSEVVNRLCIKHGVDFEGEMLAFLRRVRASGVHVLILPHSVARDGSKNNDVNLCRRLADELEDDEGVALIDQYEDPMLLRAIIGEFAIHVGCRFHGVVGALAMGVPTIIVGWSHKYNEMASPLQSDRWIIDARMFSCESVHRIYCDLAARRAEIASTILAELPSVREEAEQNFRLALTLPDCTTARV